ncbi:hypothetical protein M011DRAFT_482723 [Sporormia fimetaria CBS 119925]|uniref:Uncharacterized protein n=1 Tax=Sporormia fimetaria CBS 119925 TaxID=1340428 RepID=A0A6A6VQS8_9PLEO|nr:hypothetical protein M011DRAFT_482723 [Sporormia fimetaria CBS 119925]
MPRRSFMQDFLEGEEKPTSGPMSLAHLLQHQPNRRRPNSRPWRPMEPKDIDQDEVHNDGDVSDNEMSALTKDFGKCVLFGQATSICTPSNDWCAFPNDITKPLMPYPSRSVIERSLGSDRPADSDSVLAIASSRGSTNAYPLWDDNDETTDSGAHPATGVLGEYTKVFGKPLPDPIHLQTKPGAFDGEVVFIAHPNRDVYAHQWSQRAFMWENIGIYSHTRRRIEGSLATEVLQDIPFPENTVEYFKAAAEQRETRARLAPSQYRSSSPRPALTGVKRPDLGSVQTFGSLSSASSTFPTLGAQERTARRLESPTPSNVAQESLDDPFVDPQQYGAATRLRTWQRLDNGEGGSMDFGFQFPQKLNPQRGGAGSPTDNDPFYRQQKFIQLHRLENESVRPLPSYGAQHPGPSFYGQQRAIPLPGVSSTPSTQYFTSSSPELVQSQLRQPKAPIEAKRAAVDRVAVPQVPVMYAQRRPHVPPPGLTVANPNRVVSTLNAQAQPYVRPLPTPQTGPDPLPGAPQTLTYSDPDTVFPNRGPTHEVLSGLKQSKPPPPDFGGPFFRADTPTSTDPAESEKKLLGWFHDGQRPARQQDYANSLIQVASAAATLRTTKHPGVIGDAQVATPRRFDNTLLFVRLNETLQEYVDESTGIEERDYFTRAWKAPSLNIRDISAHGNDSFFDKSIALNTQSKGLATNATLGTSRAGPSSFRGSRY